MGIKLIIINLITLVRIIGTIILIPVYKCYGGLTVGILSMICYFTDSIDGILARKWKVSTFFGALFDGVADKLFTIINFIVLYLITPYALIPIIIEILIVLVQIIKFNRKQNVQSNIIGKSKVWILALCVTLTFLVSDINSINLLSLEFRNSILNISDNTLCFWLLLPAVIMEFLTLISYILEGVNSKCLNVISDSQKDLKLPNLSNNTWENFKNVWLNPEFYEKHKNDTNLKDLKKLSK